MSSRWEKSNSRHHAPSSLAEVFVGIALAEVGNAEEHCNNGGKYVAKYKRSFDTNKNLGAWCASATSWCIEVTLGGPESAAEYFLVAPEFWNRKRHGALALWRMAAKLFGEAGPEVGTLALWRRGGPGGWERHVAPVCEVLSAERFAAVQFNKGRFPATVHVGAHSIHEPTFIGFAKVFPDD